MRRHHVVFPPDPSATGLDFFGHEFNGPSLTTVLFSDLLEVGPVLSLVNAVAGKAVAGLSEVVVRMREATDSMAAH